MDLYIVQIPDYSSCEVKEKHHHKISRVLLTNILKNQYNIDNPLISENNGKPYLEDSNLKFSISHTNNIIGFAFNNNDNSEIGFDIEYKKTRNYLKILKYFGLELDSIEEDVFFQLWTIYEAEYKSNLKSKTKTFKYGNYVASLSYEKETEINIYISTVDKLTDNIEIVFTKKNIKDFEIIAETNLRLK